MRYLFLSPHPDDVELACGASIAKLTADGHQVDIAVFSDCGIDMIETISAHKILGAESHFYQFPRREFDQHRQQILDNLILLRDIIKPDVVFIPDQSDIHQDHQVVGIEGLRAFKMTADIISYAHSHNQVEARHNHFVVVEEKHVKTKTRALACYVSQHERFYFRPESIYSILGYYGVQCGAKYAEAFRIIRSIHH